MGHGTLEFQDSITLLPYLSQLLYHLSHYFYLHFLY